MKYYIWELTFILYLNMKVNQTNIVILLLLFYYFFFPLRRNFFAFFFIKKKDDLKVYLNSCT